MSKTRQAARQRDALDRVRSAGLRRDTASSMLDGAVRRAQAAGCSLREISEAAGVPLSTLQRQLAERE